MCVALFLGFLAMRHAVPEIIDAKHGATAGQVERALAWSLVSGLATGVGGSVVFCLEPPSRHGAAVPERVLAFLLGLAVGVMMVLSVLDMVIPKLLRWGLVRPRDKYSSILGSVCNRQGVSNVLSLCVVCVQRVDTVFAIGCGIGTIYALDALISYFDLRADDLGGHGHAAPILPVPVSSPGGKSNLRDASMQAARARSALLTTLALAAHNAPEGLAVGMASLQDRVTTSPAAETQPPQHTALVVFAIGLHNIPEGVAVAVALYNSSHRKLHSCLWSTATGLVEPLAAVLAVVALAPYITEMTLDYSLLYVGGVMVTVSVRELLPEAWSLEPQSALAGMAVGACVMLISLYVFGG